MRLPKYKVEFVGDWSRRQYGPTPQERPPRPRPPSRQRLAERNAQIFDRLQAGARVADIGRELGLTRQRIRQIYLEECRRRGLDRCGEPAP